MFYSHTLEKIVEIQPDDAESENLKLLLWELEKQQ